MKKIISCFILILMLMSFVMNVSAGYPVYYYIPLNYCYFNEEIYAENNSEYIFKADDKVIESGIVYTGCIAVSLDTGIQSRVVISGDVNCDGKVTAADARKALRVSASLDSLPPEQLFTGSSVDSIHGTGYMANISAVAADFNRSGDISAADARLILRNAANLDTDYGDLHS
ncbi:MAG: hypothetical protein IJ289_07990 [Clostridia bacterium]|nr:hypothetical protein [Clostridia bacterium]